MLPPTTLGAVVVEERPVERNVHVHPSRHAASTRGYHVEHATNRNSGIATMRFLSHSCESVSYGPQSAWYVLKRYPHSAIPPTAVQTMASLRNPNGSLRRRTRYERNMHAKKSMALEATIHERAARDMNGQLKQP